VCVACTYPCLTCSNIQTNCTSCNSTILSPYYLLQGSCLQICPNYTFSNPNGWICSTCVSPCEMCSTNASCSSCANGYNLYNQTCLLTCPLG
jgi:proprotein convertase subtilisin/kexin type 5